MRNLFDQTTLDEFWLKMQAEYSALSRKAVNKLLPFTTTYLCETAFSTMSIIKTKHRNRLDADDAVTLAISKIEPRMKELSKNVLITKHGVKLVAENFLYVI